MFDGDQVFAQFLREFRVRRKIDAMLLENFLVHESLKQVIDVRRRPGACRRWSRGTW